MKRPLKEIAGLGGSYRRISQGSTWPLYVPGSFASYAKPFTTGILHAVRTEIRSPLVMIHLCSFKGRQTLGYYDLHPACI